MIKLTRLNNSEFLLDADLIEHIELTTDTVVTPTNGAVFVVKERRGKSWSELFNLRSECSGQS